MASTVRVRFAPAPTGLLHIGNARTALYNYLFARRENGTFVLRIEDTDVERSTDASIEAILRDLRWLGISWEEGPDGRGQDGPYRQSRRLSLYQDHAEKLFGEGKVYKCFCSPERLESLRKEQLSRGMMPKYDGRCRSLSEGEIAKMKSEGIQPVLRFHVGKGMVVFEDLVHGRMSFDLNGISDFIIVRSGGMAAYNFACVIDDHAMRITHVIRGDDHLSNTPRQILLYRALGWEPPLFAHHPLILGPDRSPLSKRHGATAVSQYREEGFLPEALLNYLALLGWTSPSGEEILPMERIVRDFSLSSLSRNAPVHSRKKLEWLNSQYIRKMDQDRLAAHLLPYVERAGISVDGQNRKDLGRMFDLLKENIFLLSQVEEYLGIFFDSKLSFEEEAKTLLSVPGNRDILERVYRVAEDWTEMDGDPGSALLARLEEKMGLNRKSLYALLRAGITGKTRGPELAKILSFLGKERIVKRLKRALEIA